MPTVHACIICLWRGSQQKPTQCIVRKGMKEVCAIADSNSSRPKHKELIHSVICYLTGAEMCEKPPSQISERGGRIQMQDARRNFTVDV